MPLEGGLAYDAQTKALDLPLTKEGAYLVMVRGEDLYASGIVLVTPLEMEVREEPASGRVRVRVADARTGEPQPEGVGEGHRLGRGARSTRARPTCGASSCRRGARRRGHRPGPPGCARPQGRPPLRLPPRRHLHRPGSEGPTGSQEQGQANAPADAKQAEDLPSLEDNLRRSTKRTSRSNSNGSRSVSSPPPRAGPAWADSSDRTPRAPRHDPPRRRSAPSDRRRGVHQNGTRWEEPFRRASLRVDPETNFHVKK